ncbi:hypothetical protein ACI3LY_001314 [Candidozyma auris]|uniref:NADH dehydrogenase [ubiquinone] 1 alpha subcomplex subunit 13 n=2 Tax=Candidozyma auris TaxID=498019 RepID=A0A5Q7YNZ2_CANAR|nr:hypothetical_protein [[Candida] auris]KND98211.1 nadh-ubiquinone oxidoreductase [[Candida] auris]PIS50410.1 hypothetical protein B9J08_004229 [[Candida] auris]PIS50763.1 hypothetical protein CJI97_004294 [[Candida] auris]PSK75081.1 hypothetical protein CJJ07_005154 [[Candida] auris]QEL63000.1 hypothetical protein CJJ09_005190 [[Candida] auris]
MQDLPPIGGYQPIQWKRNIPSRGFRPSIYFWGITGIIAFGFYRFYKGVDEQRELAREKQWARFSLEPLLRAEEDRHLARRYFSELKRREKVASTMSPSDRAKFEERIYNDDTKHRLPQYTAGVEPSKH